MVSAVARAADMRHKSLHEAERPVAMLSSLYANSKRDQRKTKPVSYLDFSFYKPLDDGQIPQAHYGAAYLELLKAKRLPAWALFCYKDFAASADPSYVPTESGLVAEDAILLHPEAVGRGYQGLLIAQESAGGRYRVFRNAKGDETRLLVPDVDSKVVAREDAFLMP